MMDLTKRIQKSMTFICIQPALTSFQTESAFHNLCTNADVQ